jgi:hypothetical protein
MQPKSTGLAGEVCGGTAAHQASTTVRKNVSSSQAGVRCRMPVVQSKGGCATRRANQCIALANCSSRWLPAFQVCEQLEGLHSSHWVQPEGQVCHSTKTPLGPAAQAATLGQHYWPSANPCPAANVPTRCPKHKAPETARYSSANDTGPHIHPAGPP